MSTLNSEHKPSAEVKIVFSGPMGAGKTTAIAAISDIAPVSTDVANNDLASFNKESTTVALDFGQLRLDDGTMVMLYGTPGQERFDFMWSILGKGALGVILLLDATQANALNHMDTYLSAFADSVKNNTLVIGLGRTEEPNAQSIASFKHRLSNASEVLPLFCVDVRRREDVLLLISALMCQLETATHKDDLE